MIRNTSWKWIGGGLSAALLGAALTGCGGQNETTDTTPVQQPAAAPPTTQTETTKSETTKPEGEGGDDQAKLAAFFPGATLKKKPLPYDDKEAKHLGELINVKFTGKEGEWEVFEATQNGKRIGMAVITHSDVPGGGDMHIAFAVDTKFKVSNAAVVEAPDEAKMGQFIKQFAGKNYKAPFKLGKDLKAVPGLSPQAAQLAADAVHKGVVMLDEFFNATHGDEESQH